METNPKKYGSEADTEAPAFAVGGSKRLTGKKIAIVITDGFEESEFMEPYNTLKEGGAYVDVISLKPGSVRAWKDRNWGHTVPVDKVITDVNAQFYDALVLPGGVINADKLRMNQEVINFANGFFDDGKPIAAICHALWTLIETGELKGRTLTSYPSLKTDLKNAGAQWVDEQVVVDNGLVTSRRPDDLPAFCAKMVEEILEGKHG